MNLFKWLQQISQQPTYFSEDEKMLKRIQEKDPDYEIKNVRVNNKFTGQVRATSEFRLFQGKPSQVDKKLRNQKLVEAAGRGEISLTDIDFENGCLKGGS